MTTTRLPGFKGEFLWELEIPEKQITALADAFTADQYSWRPAPQARSVSEVLVHIAVGNFFLLDVVGSPLPADLYGQIDGDPFQRMIAVIRKNDGFEKAITSKPEIVPLVARSVGAVKDAFTNTSDEDLAKPSAVFGEVSTARRVYLRMLVHMNEHMGQLVAYTRAMGHPAPWPDWRAAAGVGEAEHS
jgi:DinB family protein